MKPIQIIAGVVAGVAGAALWAAIAYYANLEIGYLAWGIGFAVGVAVAATGEHSPTAGVVAVIITIISLLGGKYGAVEMQIQSLKAEGGWADQLEITDEDLQDYLADDIVREREAAGNPVNLPEVDDDAPLADSYPPAIWSEAGKQLRNMPADQKEEFRAQVLQEYTAFVENFQGEFENSIRQQGFLASFGVLDLVFFALGIMTAWGIATRGDTD